MPLAGTRRRSDMRSFSPIRMFEQLASGRTGLREGEGMGGQINPSLTRHCLKAVAQLARTAACKTKFSDLLELACDVGVQV